MLTDVASSNLTPSASAPQPVHAREDLKRGAAADARDPEMTASVLFTLGTRGSPLALAQANEARRLLADARGWEIERIALK